MSAETEALDFHQAPEPYPWHDGVRATLARRFARLPHALLLQGRPGLGKHAFAVQLAQALLCEQPRGAEACGQCRACHLFRAGTHPDLAAVGLIDEARSITIDQIRALGDFLALRPHSASRKVVIVSPAEALNAHAANSLLKILEEPPLGSMLLLVTSQHARLPATIRSRCSRVDFKIPSRGTGLAWLQKHPETRAAPDQLLKFAGGAPLLAESLAHAEYLPQRARWVEDLTALSHGRDHPSRCAARWKTYGTLRSLAWLSGFIADLLKRRLGAGAERLINPEAATEAFQTNNYKIIELYRYSDAILEYYRQLSGPLDELLILEDVLIRWVRLSRLQ